MSDAVLPDSMAMMASLAAQGSEVSVHTGELAVEPEP